MTWARPIILWGLIGPALGASMLLVLALLRRRRAWSRWPGITRVVAVGAHVHPVSVAHGTRRPWLLLLALACALLALAGPRWGSIDEPVYQKSREVMLALDLSRSMLVPDVPPSRLERARLLVRSLLEGLRGERVGLVVFAGTAFVQVPMSADYQILEEFLPALDPEYMPQGGTDYDGMIRSVLGGFSAGSDTDRYLIVLSDGEAADERWRERIAQLKEKAVHVIALGVGTTAGGFIPDARTGAYLKDARGAVVLSRLEPATLQALAYETAGTYRDASGWVDLAGVLRDTIERGRQGAFADRRAARAIERFQWFLAPALLFTLLGVWREIPARPRARHVRRPAAGAAATVAAALIASLMVFLPTPGRAAVVDTTESDAAGRLRATVRRLSSAESVTPAGWKAMAEQTLALAEDLKKQQQPLEPGLVHDALAGVDLGEALDARAADWPRLREDLRKLLEPPPQEEKQEQPPPEQKQEEEKKDEKESDQQQQQDQQQSPSDQQKSDQPKQEPQESKDQPGKDQQQSQGSQDQPSEQKQQPQQQSALGELKGPEQESPPPQPPAPAAQPPKTRTFGGQQGDKPPPSTDPELAAALARLREIADRDSPAVIHQRLQEQAPQSPAATRDW